MYEVIDLAPGLCSRILAFQRTAGLRYGAYDFVVPAVGEAIFLECNPAGQWLWLEDAVGIGVSQALAMELAEG
jgi:hypothetical protein